METGPNAKFARWVSLQDSLLWFCYLQLTDTPWFRSPKSYRGFESLSLRHAVWTAEKSCPSFLQPSRELCPFSAISARQTGLRRMDCLYYWGRLFVPFSDAAMTSPTSINSSGEGLTIRNRDVYEPHLTSSPEITCTTGKEVNEC